MLDELLSEYEKAYKKEWGVGLSEFMKTAAMDVFRWLDSESRLTRRAPDICPECDGTGDNPAGDSVSTDCPACGGSGKCR